jgi:hypothetical protein
LLLRRNSMVLTGPRLFTSIRPPLGFSLIRSGEIFFDPRMPTFTFRQVGVKPIEFQAMPGPKARALHAKIMRHASFLRPGGQAVLSLRTGVFRCRGARPGARAARPILRKQSRISGQNSFPADAFGVQSAYGGLPGHKLAWEQKRELLK